VNNFIQRVHHEVIQAVFSWLLGVDALNHPNPECGIATESLGMFNPFILDKWVISLIGRKT
jgi:hypothetical protein